MYYAGIGSRQTPPEILNTMTKIAQALGKLGYTLRSGGADGADKAFEVGAVKKEIFRPRHATPEAIELAMSLHPAPSKCNDYVRKLHGRNAQIILGLNLDSPVEFVICWTKNGKIIGGTGLGIRLSMSKNIPIFNLANNKDFIKLQERLVK